MFAYLLVRFLPRTIFTRIAETGERLLFFKTLLLSNSLKALFALRPGYTHDEVLFLKRERSV